MRRKRRRGWEGIGGQKKGRKGEGDERGKQVDRKGGEIMGAEGQMEGRAVKEEGEMFHLIL